MNKHQPVNPRLGGRQGKMTADEWDAEVARFDKESLGDYGAAAPSPSQAARLRRARGRPVVGEGAQRITTTIEKSLLVQADHYIRERGITRAQLITEGIKAILHKAG